ncbi:MAG: T9SS type A sorting domain-containing protein, partial [Rhodothermaceae bacterium]|nr:T9SS type A sorting domain-containing protein [Rhodothermaceae bacterium]
SPGGLSAVIASGTVPAGQTINGSLVQNVPQNAPPGSYTYTLRIGQFPNTTVDSEAFTVTVTGSARGGSWETWTVAEASPWTLAGNSGDAEAVSRSETLPAEATLAGAYPNPFNERATIGFALPEAGRVRLAVYDVLGRAVAMLVEGAVEAGRHEAVLDGARLPSGVYLVRLESGSVVQTQRLMLVH